MIVRISGTVDEVHNDHAVIDHGGIGHEVLICGHAASELAECVGQEITLYTMEYFEGGATGSNLIPRLVGFLHREDRSFFERFITVKGMGVRKALKALTQPISKVAALIEAGEAKALTQLPGIGKRAADQIVAELKGKLADFAQAAFDEPVETTATGMGDWTPAQRDALQVMMALGERRHDAERWLQRAIQDHDHDGERGADDWVRLAYRIRSSEG
jgi:holliday junction DNA helicase RuvA